MLQDPFYYGKMRWNGKVHDGLHEPIISKELFEEAQRLMKDKVKRKRLFKEYLLSGLLRCCHCGSSMTNTFTNKKKGRYYYYKCVKVVKEGKAACALKEVNAEKLESFLIENLSRIAQDKQYLENLVFKILRNSPQRMGFELTNESEKKFLTRVSEVLINFKNKVQNATQIEKCLLFRRTIERISFSKESLEVVVLLIDTEPLDEAKTNSVVSGRIAVRRRAGAADSTAPACRPISINKTPERVGFEPTVPFSTAVFKTAAIDHSATSPILFLNNRYSAHIRTQGFGNQH